MSVLGKETIAGVRLESTYGSSIAVTELIPILTENSIKSPILDRAGYIDGDSAEKRPEVSGFAPSSVITCQGVYDVVSTDPFGIDALLFAAMGDGANNVLPTLQKYYPPAGQNSKSLTFAIDKQISVWELAGFKVNRMTIAGDFESNIIVFSFEIVAQNLLRTGDSGIVNTSGIISGLNSNQNPPRMLMKDSIFRLADIDNAIADSDKLSISAFSLTFDNNFNSGILKSKDSSHTDATLPIEPRRNGFRNTQLSITVPRYKEDDLYGFLNNKTTLQADLKFTSGSNQTNIYLPLLRIDVSPESSVEGPERIQQTATFTAYPNKGTNSFMTFADTALIDQEIGIERLTERTVLPS